MKVYRSLTHRSDPCVVALGCFDGVHRGHQAVIGHAVSLARQLSLPALVWTFEEPPRNFFSPGSVSLITDLTEKKQQIRLMGVDTLVCGAFDPSVAGLSPEEFFQRILLERLNARHIVCGFNYTFGASGAGNARCLQALCETYGIGLSVLPPVTVDGTEVSSTRIRAAMEQGLAEEVSALLGRPYAIRTRVVDGQHLARRLGFPTINQVLPQGLLLPKKGVYVTRVRFGGRTRYGITNIGTRPTVNGSLLCAETHIFRFHGDLYGKTVRVELLHFLRPETKFESVELLAEQVRQDIEASQRYLKSK